MVDVRASNAKLLDRAVRIIRSLTGADDAVAEQALADAGNEVKVAVAALRLGIAADEAALRLGRAGGRLRVVLEGSR